MLHSAHEVVKFQLTYTLPIKISFAWEVNAHAWSSGVTALRAFKITGRCKILIKSTFKIWSIYVKVCYVFNVYAVQQRLITTFQPTHFQEVLLNALSPRNEYLSV